MRQTKRKSEGQKWEEELTQKCMNEEEYTKDNGKEKGRRNRSGRRNRRSGKKRETK